MSALVESENYMQFTKPAELHKAINTLRGLVAGINADDGASSSEIAELIHWCELHAEFRNRHPFSELLPVVEQACEDGVVTSEEAKDILWLCGNFTDSSAYYDATTSSIQFLAGLIHGIMADGDLSDQEVNLLSAWINANDFLAGVYPFDEIHSLLCDVLSDRVIAQEEREQLMGLFGEIIDFTSSCNLVESDFTKLRKKYSISGICAVCPKISFKDKKFCFTGEFRQASRADAVGSVVKLGGISRSAVSKKLDYLVVGNAGNPCWAYACYGRKIEEAIALRKEGARIAIVNEADFWDAVEDANAGLIN